MITIPILLLFKDRVMLTNIALLVVLGYLYNQTKQWWFLALAILLGVGIIIDLVMSVSVTRK